MEPYFTETLRLARQQANLQIDDPRERAIIVRYIEDALCRAHATGDPENNLLPELPKR